MPRAQTGIDSSYSSIDWLSRINPVVATYSPASAVSLSSSQSLPNRQQCFSCSASTTFAGIPYCHYPTSGTFLLLSEVLTELIPPTDSRVFLLTQVSHCSRRSTLDSEGLDRDLRPGHLETFKGKLDEAASIAGGRVEDRTIFDCPEPAPCSGQEASSEPIELSHQLQI